MMNTYHMDQDFRDGGSNGPDDHLSAGELAAYVDGVAHEEVRQRVEAHLSRCAPCRQDLVAVREAVRSKPSRLRWVAGAAAAAAIALLLLTPAMLENGTEPTLRGPGSAAPPATASSVEAVAPTEAAAMAAAAPRFVWRSVGPDAQYRLTITTAAGDAVATITTADTVVTSLDGTELAADTQYYWWVEALRVDRGTAESELRSFRTAP